MERCPTCNAPIREPVRYILSKNQIRVLIDIFFKIRDAGRPYLETNELYKLSDKGSSTAFLTQLKYLGALKPYVTLDDIDKRSKRPGKWGLTPAGTRFVMKQDTLPSYVIVKHEEVTERGPQVMINDPRIEWKSEETIWSDLLEFWGIDPKDPPRPPQTLYDF